MAILKEFKDALVKALNAIKKKEQAATAIASADPKEVVLLQEIRDLLKAKSQ